MGKYRLLIVLLLSALGVALFLQCISSPVAATTNMSQGARGADLPPRHPLDVSKTAPLCVIPGEHFTYQIQYQNQLLDQTFRDVIVTETLPAYVSYAGGAEWACSGQVCTHTIAEVVPGDGGTIRLPVLLEATFPYSNQTHIVNTVSTQYSMYHLSTPVGADVDLLVDKDPYVENISVAAGDLITYTLTYHNAGTVLAENVVLTETLPAHTSLVSTGWTHAGDNVYTFDLGSLSAGQGGNTQFVVRVAESLPSMLTDIINQVAIGSASRECDRSNNQVTMRTPTVHAPDMRLYVSNRDSHTIDIYDTKTYTHLGSFSAGYHPFGMTEDDGILYVVANTAPDTTLSKLVMFDMSTHQTMKDVVVGYGALHVAVLGDYVYVTNHNEGYGLTILDKQGTIQARYINFGFFGIDDDPTRGRVYATKLYMGGVGIWTITPNDGDFQRVLSVKTEPLAPHSLIYHPVTDRVYVAFGMANEVHVYDPDDFTLLGQYRTETQDPAMPGHGGHGLSALGPCIYVSNYLSRSVSILDEGGCIPASTGASSSASNVVYLPYIARGGLQVHPMAAAEPALLPAIPVNGHPKGIASGAGKIFVTLADEDRIAVINRATLTVTHEIETVGDYPHFAILVPDVP